MSSSRSIALKVLAGAGVFALSFWLTLLAMDYFESPWDPILSNPISSFGDASSSTPTLTDDSQFRFPGNGYVEIGDTKTLQCLRFDCKFSLKVAFGSSPISDTQLIIGQSSLNEPGWHLLFAGGRLILQTDGGSKELAAALAPKVGQSYKFDIVRDQNTVRLSVDGVVVAEGQVSPFTDIARDLTIGGRPGPIRLPLKGTIGDLQIARQKVPQ